MKAKVYVTLKPSVLDPQGKAIQHSIELLGYQGIKDIRQGKYFEIAMDGFSDEEKEFAAEGKLVLGICNGFQILCEAGLLPGALIRNRDLHFICGHVNVRVETADTPFTHELKEGNVLSMPIAHAEGNYVCDDATLNELRRDNRIVFRYCDANGEVTEAANPNGSRDNIAGICNRERNVMGLMPHPERACEDLLGSSDGREVFRSLAGVLATAA